MDFCRRLHTLTCAAAAKAARTSRLEGEKAFLAERGRDDPELREQDVIACASGIWLSAPPSRLNGTMVTREEWRDNVRVRYNFVPEDMPQRCDGCGKPLTVEHALQCKVGGLVHIRHEDTGDELRHLGG